MAPELLRFFVRCLLASLGIYASSWFFAFGALLFSSEALSSIGILVGYLSIYCFMIAIGLLALYGVASLLVKLFDKMSGVTRPAMATADASVYARLGQWLTHYKEKHYPEEPTKTLALDLESFEQSINAKLPQAAHEQEAWWTGASDHAQQWLREGWQVTAVELLTEEPKVMFTNVLPVDEVVFTEQE